MAASLRFIPGQTACYRCVFKNSAAAGAGGQSCQEAGVIGVLAGIIGTIQATEALKLVLEDRTSR